MAGRKVMPARKYPSGPDESGVLPFSCSTNVSNDVLEHLRRAKLGSAAMEFCLYMHRRTFGDAGYHRSKGRQETACTFDLAQWAAEIPNDKSNVRRIRADLEACHIITFTEDETTPGRGIIAWNTAYAEWQLYDKRRLPKRASVVISPEPTSNITTLASYKITTLTYSKQLRSSGENDGNITTDACLDSAAEAARRDPLRKEKEETEKKIETNVSNAADAVAAPAASPEHSEQEPNGTANGTQQRQTPQLPAPLKGWNYGTRV
jgi:hypothetical protein